MAQYSPVMSLVSPQERFMHILAVCDAITDLRPYTQLDNGMTYNRAGLLGAPVDWLHNRPALVK